MEIKGRTNCNKEAAAKLLEHLSRKLLLFRGAESYPNEIRFEIKEALFQTFQFFLI
jgi:hypothetical protein